MRALHVGIFHLQWLSPARTMHSSEDQCPLSMGINIRDKNGLLQPNDEVLSGLDCRTASDYNQSMFSMLSTEKEGGLLENKSSRSRVETKLNYVEGDFLEMHGDMFEQPRRTLCDNVWKSKGTQVEDDDDGVGVLEGCQLACVDTGFKGKEKSKGCLVEKDNEVKKEVPVDVACGGSKARDRIIEQVICWRAMFTVVQRGLVIFWRALLSFVQWGLVICARALFTFVKRGNTMSCHQFIILALLFSSHIKVGGTECEIKELSVESEPVASLPALGCSKKYRWTYESANGSEIVICEGMECVDPKYKMSGDNSCNLTVTGAAAGCYRNIEHDTVASKCFQVKHSDVIPKESAHSAASADSVHYFNRYVIGKYMHVIITIVLYACTCHWGRN